MDVFSYSIFFFFFSGNMLYANKARVEEHLQEDKQAGGGTFMARACVAHRLVGWCGGVNFLNMVIL